MRILLTGCLGQVGFELQRSLAPLGEVHAMDRAECDLADESQIRKLVSDFKPHLIVNPAAYTAVDKAESERDAAQAINARAPGIFGEEAAKLGAWVIHFSTDYVFDGSKLGPYSESDATNPKGVYGRTKRDGELALLASGARCLILRTSWVVGAHGGNFAKTMLRLAADRDALSVVADQFGSPTSAALLGDITAQLVRQVQREGQDSFPFGLYHLVADGETNWHEYACFVIEEAARLGVPLKARRENIKPISTAEYPTPAQRPTNSRLDTTHFKDTFGLLLPNWQSGVRHVLQQIVQTS